METIVVVGGGISGMYAALKLKMVSKNREVILLETQPRLGGLLSGIDFAGVTFDTGVHTFYETGIEDLDRDLYDIAPPGGWIDLPGTKRDLGGAYYDGSMHYGNSYLGFEGLPNAEMGELIRDFMSIGQNETEVPNNAAEFLTQRFGSEISTRFLFPLVEKFTGRCPSDVHQNVASILPLTRINLLSSLIDTRELTGDFYNSRLAFSDQRKLPENLIPKKKAFYPKGYGTQTYVDAFEARLLSLGVKIYRSCQIDSVQNSEIVVGGIGNFHFDRLIWTPNPITFSKFSDLEPQANPIPSIQKTAIVSYLLSREPYMKDLYYGYSLEPSHLTHRFSSPFTFCPSSRVGDLYRFTNEVVFQSDLSSEQIEKRSTDELVSMGLIEKESIVGSLVSIVKGGYPDLSNSLVTDTLLRIEKIKERASNNIEFIGVMSKPNLFFQNDVLLSAYNLVQSI